MTDNTLEICFGMAKSGARLGQTSVDGGQDPNAKICAGDRYHRYGGTFTLFIQ